MPFLFDSTEDELKKKQQEQAGQGQNLSGQSSVIANPNAPQSKPGTPKQSGSWTNLQSYLDANKENAAGMSSTIANKVDSDATQAKGAIETYKTNSPVETHKYTEDELNSEFYVEPVKADKPKYVDLKTTGGYSGPQYNSEVDGYEDAHKKTNNSVTQVKNLGSEEGRVNLLTDTFGRSNYSQGMKTFDNLLLQNDPTAKGKFTDVAQKWSGLDLGGFLDSVDSFVSGRIDTNKGVALENKKLVPVAEGNKITTFSSPINQRVDETKVSAPKEREGFMGAIKNDKFTPEQLALLGIKTGDQLFGLDLSSYVTPNESEITADWVATPEERAMYGALTQLMDKDPTLMGLEDKSYSPFTVDSSKLKADLAGKQKEFEDWAKTQNIHSEAFADDPMSSTYKASSDANLWDYIQNPESLVSTGDWTDVLSVDPGEAVKASLDQRARDSAFSQIKALLDQWKYGDLANSANQEWTDKPYTVERVPGKAPVQLPQPNAPTTPTSPTNPGEVQSIPTPNTNGQPAIGIGANGQPGVAPGGVEVPINNVGFANSPTLGVQLPTVETPNVSIPNTGMASSPTLGIQLPTIQVPKIKWW